MHFIFIVLSSASTLLEIEPGPPIIITLFAQSLVISCLTLLSNSHGANDTQKIIGIITLALMPGESVTMHTAPLWVRISGGLVMFMGTMIGGWTIMRTIGRGVYRVRVIHSLNSQLASAGSLILATLIGAPVSTTHVVVGTVMGVGAADEYKMVHLGIAKEIILAWFITIPLSALVYALIYIVFNFVFKVM